MPIYYVIVEQVRGTALSMQLNIQRIIKVFECDITDIDRLWRQVSPMQDMSTGRYFQGLIFVREPANPFHELSKKDN